MLTCVDVTMMRNPITLSTVRIDPPFTPSDTDDADRFQCAFNRWCEQQWEIKKPCDCTQGPPFTHGPHGGDPATANPADFYQRTVRPQTFGGTV
jgi:hypothetical protein